MFSFRLIEELKLSLKSKDALIQCLKEEKSQMASPDETVSSGELQGLSAALRGDGEGEAEVRHGGVGALITRPDPPWDECIFNPHSHILWPSKYQVPVVS